tara:strand:+ start:2516 stop:3016 length:501 start_codon:yes stop_codon:yes gene_type:complete
MPKAQFSSAKGLVQKSGSSLQVAPSNSSDFGLYAYSEDVTLTLGNTTLAGSLSKTLPANSNIISISMSLVTAGTAGNNQIMNLQLKANADVGGTEIAGASATDSGAAGAADLNVGANGVVGTTITNGLLAVGSLVTVNVVNAGNNTGSGSPVVNISVLYVGNAEPA